MHRSLFVIVVLCVLAGSTFCPAAQPGRSLLDGVAAIVGDESVLLSELEAYMLMRLNALNPDKDSAGLTALREKFLNELIDGKVLLVHAKKDSTISVKSEEVESALDMHVKRIMAENRMSQQDFEAELTKQGLTLAKARAQWRKGMQDQLLKQKVQQSQVASFEVSQKEVQAFFNTYRDSLPQYGESVRLLKLAIDVTPTDSVRQAAFTKITRIKTRLDNGEAFEELARQFSDDPTGASGGDLGFIAKGTLTEIVFEEKAFALRPGEISEPFQTRMGFHIVKVEGKKEQMVHVKHILVQVAPAPTALAAVQARLDSIRTSCTTRDCFMAAAAQFSTDRQSRSRGGDIGWYETAALPEEYRGAFDTLSEGAVSRPIQSGYTYTLLMIDKKVLSRPLTLEDDYNLLAEKAKDIYAQKRLVDLVKKWRQDVYIEIRL